MALSSGAGVALGAAVTFDRFARHSLIQLASLIQLLLLGPCAVIPYADSLWQGCIFQASSGAVILNC